MIYQMLSSIFQHYESNLSVAQAHGIAVAMLCVKGQSDSINWLKEIFEEHVLVTEEHKRQLCNLFEQTRDLLNPDESMFEFDLWLPDNVSLFEKTTALINWCEGFLWGMAYTRSQGDWQGETPGILRDMVEFTKLDKRDEEDNDDDEAAFIQIHEYLRAAVLIVYDELNTTTHSEQSRRSS